MANDCQKPFFFITGVHRSGTSAMAQLLNAMGVELGGDLLQARPGINESGFWEHARAIDFNERIFQRLGSSWYDFRPLPAQWWLLEALSDLRAEARQWLEDEFQQTPMAGIKDPRLCRLLPFWMDVVRSLGWQPFAVVMYRRPESVAESLERRDGFSPFLSKILWLAYSFDAEENTRSVQTAYIDYDYLLESPARMVKNLRRYFSQVVFRDNADAKVDAVLRKELRHHVAADHDDVAQDEFDLVSRQVMDNLAEPRTPDALARMDNLACAFSDYAGRSMAFGDCIADLMHRFVGANHKLSSLGLMHAHAQQVVSRRDGQLAAQTQELKECRKYIEELELRSKNQASTLGQMREKMSMQDDALARLQAAAVALPQGGGQLPRLSDSEKRLADAKAVLARRTEEMRELLVKIKDMGGQMVALEANLQSEKQLGALANQRADAAESGYVELRQIVTSQHELIQDAQRYRAATEKNLAGMAARLHESELRNRKLQDALALLDASCIGLREAIAEQQRKLDAERAKVRDHIAQEQFFSHQFAQLSAEIAAANEAVVEYQRKLSDAEQALSDQGRHLHVARQIVAERDRTIGQLNDKYFYTRTRLFVRIMVRLGIYKVPHE